MFQGVQLSDAKLMAKFSCWPSVTRVIKSYATYSEHKNYGPMTYVRSVISKEVTTCSEGELEGEASKVRR
jgi:hypothetical protein